MLPTVIELAVPVPDAPTAAAAAFFATTSLFAAGRAFLAVDGAVAGSAAGAGLFRSVGGIVFDDRERYRRLEVEVAQLVAMIGADKLVGFNVSLILGLL